MHDRIAQAEPASFRDPDSRVWNYGDRLLRSIDAHTAEVIRSLGEANWIDDQVARGRLVATRVLDRAERPADLPVDAAAVLEHQRLPVVTYPYEWSFSMLADAGLLHLELQEALLDPGFSLKDATAFNVLFDRHTPRFIDFGSFERPARLDVWYAYGQFCRMFLFPLLLKLHRGLPLASQYLPGLDGVDVEQCYRALGGWRSWTPACWMDVGMQHALQRKDVSSTQAASPALTTSRVGNPEVQKINLRRLGRKLLKLKQAYHLSGVWSEYRDSHSYVEEADRHKQDLVKQWLEQQRPPWVLDLGCNTGVYSRIAAGTGAHVISVDSDHDSIERLYRELQQKPADIHPVVANVATPTPGVGFLGEERRPLLGRIQADAVLGLALVHHLLVSARLTLPMIADLFHRVSRQSVIIEYVDPSDEMFQTLLRFRTDDFSGLTLASFRAAMAVHFDEVSVEEVKPGKRWLLNLKRKTAGVGC